MVEEYRRVEVHNKVLPKAFAGLLGAGALAIGINYAVAAVLLMNVIMFVQFNRYRKIWRVNT